MKNTLFAVVITAAVVLFGCGQKVNIEAIKSAKASADSTLAAIEKTAQTAQAEMAQHKETLAKIKFPKGDETMKKMEEMQASIGGKYQGIVAKYKENSGKFDELLKEAGEGKVSAIDAVKQTTDLVTGTTSIAGEISAVNAEMENAKKMYDEVIAKYGKQIKK
jgi:peptidoglycan hydrolase CwlO-like protein